MLRFIAAGLLAGGLSIGWAQEETLVITATRFPDSRRDLPVGVTVISADDIRKSATSNLPEILAHFGPCRSATSPARRTSRSICAASASPATRTR